MGVGAAPVITGSGVGNVADTGEFGFGVSGSAFTAVAEAGIVADSFEVSSRGSFSPRVTNRSLFFRRQNAINCFQPPCQQSCDNRSR